MADACVHLSLHNLQVIPSSVDVARERLQAAENELAAMDALQARIGRRAAWRQRGLVWGGLGSQLALWGLLYRLTYYELSWDVMEPVCFFVGGGQALAAYCYFVLTRTEFGWEAALQRYVGRWEAARLSRAGFDINRYTRLQAEAKRLNDLVQAAEQQAAAAVAVHGGPA